MGLRTFMLNRPATPWRVEHRPAGAAGAWSLLHAVGDEARARDEALCPAVPPAHGDLVRVLRLAAPTHALWVASRDGLVPAPPLPPSLCAADRDWVTAWEVDADPCALLGACGPVDVRRLVLAGCDLLGPALGLMPTAETRPAAAVAAARAWALGDASDGELKAASQGAFRARLAYVARTTRESPEGDVNLAAWELSDAPRERAHYERYVSKTAAALARPDEALAAEARSTARRLRARAVRRWVPLSVVLLAHLGEPTPPSLGF